MCGKIKAKRKILIDEERNRFAAASVMHSARRRLPIRNLFEIKILLKQVRWSFTNCLRAALAQNCLLRVVCLGHAVLWFPALHQTAALWFHARLASADWRAVKLVTECRSRSVINCFRTLWLPGWTRGQRGFIRKRRGTACGQRLIACSFWLSGLSKERVVDRLISQPSGILVSTGGFHSVLPLVYQLHH